jgi:hypothetical protein
MPQQQIIWTALPNGRTPDGGTLIMSVVASPRLRLDGGANGMLQSFPDFLDWPGHVQQNLAGFDLIVDGDEARPIATTLVPAPSTGPAPSELWKALFSPSTLVRSQQLQQFQAPVATYSVSGVAAQLQSGYTQLAQRAPFRPADNASFKQSFATLTDAPPLPAAGQPLRARLAQLHAQSPDDLSQMQHELAASLLRPEPELSFEDKLTGINSVASALASAAQPEELVKLVPDTPHPAGAFAQFAAFHRRAMASTPSGIAAVSTAAQPDDDIDFHRALTALGEYSWLLRRLGFVFDLKVDAARVPTSRIGALRQIAARPRFSSPAAGASSFTTLTKYILDNDATGPLPFPVFLAAPRAAATAATLQTQFEIVGGLLNLGQTRPPPPPTSDLQFDVFNVDVDGAAKKVLNAIRMASVETQSGPIDPKAETSAPALQTSGLMLIRTGQADQIMNDVKNAHALEDAHQAGQPVVLFAEDLVRGYRIDIRHFPPGFRPGDPQPPWLSLHQRTADFHFKREGESDLTAIGVLDEGCVQPVLLQDNSGGTNSIYIHESYAHWQDWSLSAPFPANPIGLTRGDTLPPNAPIGLKQVEITVQAKNRTLPRLRFGHLYQMGVRTVDLAGNGLTLDQAQAMQDSLRQSGRPEVHLPIQGQQLPYRRFDPIASPVLVLREELTEGEAIDMMVIRSNGPSTTTASYAASLADGRYHGFNDRHIAPPKSSQRMAQRHGKLDAAFGIAGQPLSVFAMLGRDAGTLNDKLIVNIQTGEAEPLPDVIRTGPSGTQTTIPNGLRFIATDQARDPNSGYTIHYEDQLRLPYLPDPMADGCALFGLPGLDNESLVLVESATPGVAGTLQSKRSEQQLLPQQAIDALGLITKIGFPQAGQWPELRCFGLRLDGLGPADSRTPTWSDVNGTRMLTVRLAPAETGTIWISTYPRPEDVALFGLQFSWSRLGAPEGDRQFIELAQHGALAMLTPAHKVVLVHAVQQPLIEPRVDGTPFATRRFPSDTIAYLAGRFKIHGKSTERIDLEASWIEPQQESETTRLIDTHVLEVPIHLHADPPNLHADPVPLATYTDATDRLEFNAPATQADAHARTFLAHHEFGDTRHRHVTYRLVATTRFKEYFPARITTDPANLVKSSSFDVHVLNSVRPPALEITRIVPAFQWNRSLDLTSSNRSGGWLRVYLGSKWFATGEGEAVAIVGDPVAGADPIHATQSSTQRASIIPKPAPVIVAGQKLYPFVPHRDDTVGLWYADLAFDVSGLYFPFVGVRLARFQQQSVDGLWLSSVIDAGFYQLAPDRTAALTFFDVVEGQPDKRRIEISISGPQAPAATQTSGLHLSYSVEVEIEERPLAEPADQRDAHLGWKPSTTAVPVAAPSPGADLLWHGSVIVPAVADRDRRIVIKEFEIFPPNDPPPGQAWSGEAAGSRRRLVYADTIAVR